MTVVPFSSVPARSARHASLIVVFADFQREHATPGRAFAVREGEACLARSRRWLELARSMMLPVAHFRQYRSGTYFNRASPFSDWIDGFRPRTDETLYERSRASCYADSGFSDFTTHVADPRIIRSRGAYRSGGCEILVGARTLGQYALTSGPVSGFTGEC